MKEKKNKTIKQQKNKERAAQYALFTSEFAVIPIPFAIMAAVNWNEWFAYNPGGWKIGLGGTIAIALMSLAALMVSSMKEDKRITGGFVAIVMVWYTLAFIALLLSEILAEIYKIMFIGGSGLLAAFGLDLGSKQMKKKADLHKSAIVEAEKELNKEQAKEEIIKDNKKSIRF